MITKIQAKLSFATSVLRVLAYFALVSCTNSTATEHATGLTEKEGVLSAAGWTPLFNGKNLDGWTQFPPAATDASASTPATSAPATSSATASPPTWSVLDGILRTTGAPVGYIATTSLYTDFELELEWRFDPAKGPGNSGVLLRVQTPDKVWPTCLEAQLESGNAGDIWNIGNFPATVDAARTDGRHTKRMSESNELPLGQWNKYRIVMDGGWLSLWVNGKLQNVASGVQHVPGRIALQSEGAWIEFRDIRVRELPVPKPEGSPKK